MPLSVPSWSWSWVYFLRFLTGRYQVFRAFLCINTNFGQVGQQVCCPAIHVVLLHFRPHAMHPRRLLIVRHFQRAQDRRRCLLHVVWIHLQGVCQFQRGSRKRTQNQHPVFVVTRCHELFRHQVHSVVQRSHHAQRRCVVKPG